MKFVSAVFTLPPRGGVPFVTRLIWVLIGLPLYGVAVSLMLHAGIGLNPWDVFHQGLSDRSGISFGTVSIIVGVGVLLLWIPLRQKLGIGTALNVVIIGLVIDLVLPYIPVAPNIWWGLAEFTAGILLNGLAIAIYVGAGLGPGPRDGLMTGIVSRFGKPVWLVRTSIELIVLAMGWLLGGTIGLGTVYYALAIGPVAHVLMPWFSLDERATRSRAQSGNLNQVEENLEGH